MKLVTGGAGFIGSHVVEALLARGETVRVLDNLRTGRRDALKDALATRRCRLVKGDLLRLGVAARALKDTDEAWHLAADADVRRAATHPRENFEQGAEATLVLLEAMRRRDVKRLIFTSSSVVYGEPSKFPTPEDYGPLLPISAYGAAKLAAEGLIAAHAHLYGIQAWIFRFGNVVGPRLTHGVIYDFHRALRKDPRKLTILGDGRQEKSYLSTQDCVAGLFHGRDFANDPVNLFNLASHEATTVKRIAELVSAAHGLPHVKLQYTGGARGWPGDVTRMRLSVARMARIGWRPKHSSEDAVRRAAEWVARTA